MKHKKYILRCLELAKNGIGTTRPNPSVGAVIVLNDVIIGEGFTSAYGGNHAEVNAINSIKDVSTLKKATLYVTLEPCSHFGKTPPCADLIVKHQIKNVVIGCVDANSLVSGKGIERLKKSGCNVTVGVLEKECLEHHKRFFTVQEKKRPYIILKWAETADGFIAPENKSTISPVWISNQYSQQLVHKWRSEEHAILVGTNTVIADNPKLNVRSWSGNNPVRIVLDKSLRIPLNANVFDGSVKTIVMTEEGKRKEIRHYKQSEAIFFEQIDFSVPIAAQICKVLYRHKIQSVIIEGGAQTLQLFIDAGLWDEARVFIGIAKFEKGVKAPRFSNNSATKENIQGNILNRYLND